MKKRNFVEDVMGLTTIGMKAGRENILKFLKYHDAPQDRLKVFHVAGSNGKGSVCQMLRSSLKSCGHRVGVFTSPHLIRINERFSVDEEEISTENLNTLYWEIFTDAEKWGIELSFFEIQVIAAVLYFSRIGVDYAVFEVGLGWLHDGTNIFEKPVATYITSITLEHTHILGDTIEDIERNKVGIARPWVPLFTYLDTSTIRWYCDEVRANLQIVLRPDINTVLTNLRGSYQQKNAHLVAESLRSLGFDEDKVRKWLMQACHPGRLQWIRENILVDTVNTIDAMQWVVDYLDSEGVDRESLVVVFGCTQLDPKYCAGLVNMIGAEEVYLVGGFHRAQVVENYQEYVSGFTGACNSPSEIVFEDEGKYLVVGSVYLVGEVMQNFSL